MLLIFAEYSSDHTLEAWVKTFILGTSIFFHLILKKFDWSYYFFSTSQDGHIFQKTRKNQIITCRQQNKTPTLLLYITITLRGNSFRQWSVHPGAYLLRWMVCLLYEEVGDGARWCTVVSLPRSACCWLCYSGSYSESYNASEAESDKCDVMYTCFQKRPVFLVF